MPPFDLDQLESGSQRQYTMNISSKEKAKINEIFAKNHDIIVYTDGSCYGNPGPAGAGVAFYVRSLVNDTSFAATASDTEREVHQEESLRFLFGASLHLGWATNNYAEYCGLLLA